MKGLTFMQLCHAISLTLFVHSFYADSSLQSSSVPISFMANDYRNNSHRSQHHIDGERWANTTSANICPEECTCLYALSTFVSILIFSIEFCSCNNDWLSFLCLIVYLVN